MNDSATGRAIGQDTLDAQIASGQAFLAAHPDFVHLSPATQQSLVAAFALQMAQIAGNAEITHVPGWDQVTSAPNTGSGLDRPMPSLAQQVDGVGNFVALWLKTGTAATAWTTFGGGGGGGGGGSDLTVGYSVNFTALAGQNLMTGGDGAKTVNGKTIYVDNSGSASSMFVNDGTHAGLYVRCNAYVTDDYGSGTGAPRVLFGLSDLTGVKAISMRDAWAMAIISQPHTPDNSYEAVKVHMCNMPCTPDSTGIYRKVLIDKGLLGSLQIYCQWDPGGGATSYATAPDGMTVPSYSSDVFAFRVLANRFVELYVGQSVGGDFPALSALHLLTTVDFYQGASPSVPWTPLAIQSAQSAAFQWGFGVTTVSTNTAGNSDALISRLKILYR
jgi:hypothetical protein